MRFIGHNELVNKVRHPQTSKELLMPIYEELLATGCYLSNHCSDLYVEVNEQTTKIVKEYQGFVSTFTNEVTGKINFEIPFAYDYRKLGNIK